MAFTRDKFHKCTRVIFLCNEFENYTAYYRNISQANQLSLGRHMVEKGVI